MTDEEIEFKAKLLEINKTHFNNMRKLFIGATSRLEKTLNNKFEITELKADL